MIVLIIRKTKTELENLDIKPKKTLGQNFLINEGIYRKITTALEIKVNDNVIEIGPGLGTLTELLAANRANIFAIEKDDKLAEYLKTKFANQKNVTIINEDIRKFNPDRLNLLSEVEPLKHYKVVGNIPYYLTSHLIRTIFEQWPTPQLIVLMIQKEVAQRICAKPPHMSLLAVWVQYYAHSKITSYVSKNSFWPSPEVNSAVIRLTPKTQTGTDLTRTDMDQFFRIVKSGFAGKRKQLGNNLARGLKLPKNIMEEKLRSAGIDPQRRAETLTLNEWQSIATMLLPH